MILTCPACQTRYKADASKFPPQGRDVRCARCGHTWHQAPPEPEPTQDVLPPEPETPASPPPPPQATPEPEAPQPEQYAQPPVRDEEPQAQEQEKAVQQQPEPAAARASKVRKLGLSAGWIGLAAVVLAAVLGTAIFRGQIVHAWPRSASLYAALGMTVPASGLQIDDVKWHVAMEGGQVVGTVTGTLTNVSSRELPVPQLRVGLIGSEKHELYHWTFAPDVMTLRPGQTMRFETRLSSPPEGAHNLEVRFAKAGE